MPVAKGRRQIVIVDRPAALAGRTADWRETSFVGQTAALSYRVDRRLTRSNPDSFRVEKSTNRKTPNF
jgi:hypothetical protein